MAGSTPFLTLEDPNARIKGSRDPLGLVVIWSTFGRRVIGNLTTQSRSVRGFTTLLLGRWLADRLVSAGKAHAEDALDIFLRMEQLSAYVRRVAHDERGEIRGIERVERNLRESGEKPRIGTDRGELILSDQKTYGLWGLYTVPARVSGWLPDGPVGVTALARDFVEAEYWPTLQPVARALEQLVLKGGRLDTTRGGTAVFRALADVLQPAFSPAEIDFYGRDLRDGLGGQSLAGSLQQGLRVLFEGQSELDQPVGRIEVEALVARARREHEALAEQLARIASTEALLAPADRMFEHVLARSGKGVGEVAGELAKHWRHGVPHLDRSAFGELVPGIRAVTGPAIATQIDGCHSALAERRFDDAIRALVDWNRLVMEQRHSGPWVRIGEADILDVRYRGIERLLPTDDELPTLWQNSYFLDSLKSVTRQLQAKRGTRT